MGQAREDFAQISVRVEAAPPAAFNDRVNDRAAFPGLGLADKVAIELRLETGALRLTVRDNGCGFDYAAARNRAEQGGSLGLMAMEERVSLLGGRLTCQSSPGQGTELVAVLPLQNLGAAVA